MTVVDVRSRWLRTFRPRPDCVARLVGFPHAGGAANAFTTLAAALPHDVELVAVQYPGRQDRRAESPAPNVRSLARGVVGALAELDDRPLLLLGHSFGALVAFETARLIEAGGGAPVAHLFASAARPPSEDWEEPDLDGRSDATLVDGLRRLGGIPPALLDDPETVAEMLRILRADHRCLIDYGVGNGVGYGVGYGIGYSADPDADVDATVAAPITVLLADADPKNSATQVAGWARHTTGGYAVETVSGGHFAVIERAAEVVPLLVAPVRPPAPAPYSDLTRTVIVAGLAGQRPSLPTDLTTVEDAARVSFTPEAFGYVAGHAGSGATGRANREAFDRWRLLPRMLRGAARRDLSVTVLGQRLPVPVLLAPVAAQTLVHPEGELATVRAATDVGVPFVLSGFSSRPLEEVARAADTAAGAVPRWFQLYQPRDRAVAESLIRRAEAAGYTAIVVTVDTGSLGYRPAELDLAYSPFLRGIGIANYTSDPAFRAGLPAGPGGSSPMAAVGHWAAIATDPTVTWDGLAWLRGRTTLPILVKGILHPADARLALTHGADGVIVSNHGARQLDGSVAALDALPAVRAAVGDHTPVLMDSGVRSGTDVVKALALGADAVLYGRPYVYGLGLDGQAGVKHVLRCLLADLDLALGLIGCRTVADVTGEYIVAPGTVPTTRV